MAVPAARVVAVAVAEAWATPAVRAYRYERTGWSVRGTTSACTVAAYLPPVLPLLLPAGVAGLPSTLRRASAWALVSVLSIACSAVIGLP